MQVSFTHLIFKSVVHQMFFLGASWTSNYTQVSFAQPLPRYWIQLKARSNSCNCFFIKLRNPLTAIINSEKRSVSSESWTKSHDLNVILSFHKYNMYISFFWRQTWLLHTLLLNTNTTPLWSELVAQVYLETFFF